MYMVFLVLDDPDKFDEVIQSWRQLGICGATIFESTGLGRHLQHLIPMRYIFRAQSEEESGNLTIMAIVDNLKAVKDCLKATETVTGNLDEPNTGIFAAWPLSTVKGLPPTKR